MVLKADGLAAGKGVIICNNDDELDKAIDDMFTNKKFGMDGTKFQLKNV